MLTTRIRIPANQGLFKNRANYRDHRLVIILNCSISPIDKPLADMQVCISYHALNFLPRSHMRSHSCPFLTVSRALVPGAAISSRLMGARHTAMIEVAGQLSTRPIASFAVPATHLRARSRNPRSMSAI